MKKAIVPILIFAAVYSVCLFAGRYILLNAEFKGFCALTPEYLENVFSHAWPVSTLLNDFLVQFFRFIYIAPAIVAFIITATFFITRSIFSKIGVKSSIPGTVLALASWGYMAEEQDMTISLAAILIGLVILIILSAKESPLWEEGTIGLGICLLLILGCSIALISNRTLRREETWSTVEYFACTNQWDSVLETLTPEYTVKEKVFLPYALLALETKGELEEKKGNYFVVNIEHMEMDGEDYHSLLFTSLLCETQDNPQEASIMALKAGNLLSHHTSFQTLRRLTELSYSYGNYALVQKYCTILRQSLFNRKFADRYLKLAGEEHKNRSREILNSIADEG